MLVPQPDGGEAPAREPVVSAAAGGTGTRPRAHASHPAHVVRSERTPVTPVGSLRPPHADRTPRGGSTTPARPVAGG